MGNDIPGEPGNCQVCPGVCRKGFVCLKSLRAECPAHRDRAGPLLAPGLQSLLWNHGMVRVKKRP